MFSAVRSARVGLIPLRPFFHQRRNGVEQANGAGQARMSLALTLVDRFERAPPIDQLSDQGAAGNRCERNADESVETESGLDIPQGRFDVAGVFSQ